VRLFAAHIDASFTVADATTLPFDGGELSAATPRRSAGDVSQPNTHSGIGWRRGSAAAAG
jgi:hypothetical protein